MGASFKGNGSLSDELRGDELPTSGDVTDELLGYGWSASGEVTVGRLEMSIETIIFDRVESLLYSFWQVRSSWQIEKYLRSLSIHSIS